MTDELRLTPYNAARLANWAGGINHLFPLMHAGIPEDIAVDILLARQAQGAIRAVYAADAAVYTAYPDTDLLVTLVNDRVYTPTLLDDAGRCLATREEIDTCVRHDIAYDYLTDWLTAGRSIDQLDEALAELDATPGDPCEHIIAALLAGVSTTDLAWLASRIDLDGQTLRVHPHLQRPDREAARRLALMAMACDQKPDVATLVALAAGDAPWIDMLTTLIADGGDFADAITTAQVEHAVHEQQARRIPRTPSPAPGRTP